jgi:hypothetical protein
MRATRRRPRQLNPLASVEAVRFVLHQLKQSLPDLIPDDERDVLRILHAARHVQRYRATDSKRGRRSKFNRDDLIKVGARLSDILDRETSGHISMASFVDHYLRLFDFPSDVLDALKAGEINLFEAAQLERLNPARMGVSKAQAKRVRLDLLRAHVQAGLSGPRLRLRVNELLGVVAIGDGTGDGHGARPDDLVELDPYDATHLFWEQLRQLLIALREIRPEDVSEDDLEELLKSSEPIMTVINRIRRRKDSPPKPAVKFKP